MVEVVVENFFRNVKDEVGWMAIDLLSWNRFDINVDDGDDRNSDSDSDDENENEEVSTEDEDEQKEEKEATNRL